MRKEGSFDLLGTPKIVVLTHHTIDDKDISCCDSAQRCVALLEQE